MGRLGDNFPDDVKREYVRRHLVAGQVLYLFCPFTQPQKEKYLVLVCPGMVPLVFVINSEISDFIKKRGLENTQVMLKASEYDFLDHDSYVDCSNVRDDFSYADLMKQLSADTRRIKGELSAASKAAIAAVTQQARTINRIHKRMIVAALGPNR